jgi:hypothetical protein
MLDPNDPDFDYRMILMGHGVPPNLVESCTSKQLDNIGRILTVYRPGVSMEQADPVHYQIMKSKFEHDLDRGQKMRMTTNDDRPPRGLGRIVSLLAAIACATALVALFDLPT